MHHFFSKISIVLTSLVTTSLLLVSIMLSSCGSKDVATAKEDASVASGSTLKLVKKWETDSTLTTSESVILDEKAGLLYVACIGGVPPDSKDGDGFIAQVAIYGNIVEDKWVTGLDAPKGMGIFADTLYVADITDVVRINRKTGEIIDRIAIEDAAFLNDITTDEAGHVFVSDTRANRIHKITNGNSEVWLEDTDMGGPNGLYVEANRLMVATFGSGNFGSVDLETKKFDSHSVDIPSGDGIVKLTNGYLVSNWNGEVYHVNNHWQQTRLLDTKGVNVNAADIALLPSKNMLLVPTFFKNSVVAYEIQDEM